MGIALGTGALTRALGRHYIHRMASVKQRTRDARWTDGAHDGVGREMECDQEHTHRGPENSMCAWACNDSITALELLAMSPKTAASSGGHPYRCFEMNRNSRNFDVR
jgi:hypothetical protein